MRLQRLGVLAPSLAVVGALVAGCGGSSAGRTAQAGPSVTVRTCSMVGSGGLAAGYRRRALVFGPLALANLRTVTGGEPLPGRAEGRYAAYEVIAIVNAGANPMLSVPRSEWPTVGLLYDPNKFRDDGLYRVQDLDQVVRFRACKSRSFNHGVSQFDGGFVVTSGQCVHFLVTVPHGPTYHGQFPAAAPCSRSS
jgi:hypothetical protein